jgi:hypothetical protein
VSDDKRHRFIESADPSWYRRVLEVLDRDYPKISDEVWMSAISENSAEMVAKYRRPYAEPTEESAGPDRACGCSARFERHADGCPTLK